jgi:hypothetical protein
MKNIARKKTKKIKKTASSAKQLDSKDFISQQAIDLLVQIVRGELIKEEGEITHPTVAQRLAAAQMLLKMKERPTETEAGKVTAPIMDLPNRSKNFDEWLQRMHAMQPAGNI